MIMDRVIGVCLHKSTYLHFYIYRKSYKRVLYRFCQWVAADKHNSTTIVNYNIMYHIYCSYTYIKLSIQITTHEWELYIQHIVHLVLLTRVTLCYKITYYVSMYT